MQSEKEKFKKEFIKRLIRFSVKAIDLSDTLTKQRISRSIADQLIRSSTSIGANVVEAKSSSSKRDYTRFFEIALKSSNETKYWLLLLKELNIEEATKITTNNLLKEADEISKILGSSVLTLKGKNSI